MNGNDAGRAMSRVGYFWRGEVVVGLNRRKTDDSLDLPESHQSPSKGFIYMPPLSRTVGKMVKVPLRCLGTKTFPEKNSFNCRHTVVGSIVPD